MKSKDTKKRKDIPPLEDDALDAVTGGWTPEIPQLDPNPAPAYENVINCVCRQCGKKFTWSSGSTVLCDKCTPNLPKIIKPPEIE